MFAVNIGNLKNLKYHILKKVYYKQSDWSKRVQNRSHCNLSLIIVFF